jgi:hypothetical protein
MRLKTTLSILVTAAAVITFTAPGAGAAPEHKNLQVLDKNISAAELKRTMEGFAAQLGVKCTFCHIEDQHEKDDRKQKADARRMIKLVMEMKARKAEFFKATVKDSAIQCSMCHRGKPQPEVYIP